MKSTHAAASNCGASHSAVRLYLRIVDKAGWRHVIIASVLAALSTLCEGLLLLFLLPLIQSLDGAADFEKGSKWQAHLLQSLGLSVSLNSVLGMFLCFAAARLLINRQSTLYLTWIQLKLLRDFRVELYSAIASASWSYLRKKRPADFLSALTAEIDRLETAVHYALNMPGRALNIAAHITAAWLITPALTVSALAGGVLFAWLGKGRLTESMRLGGALSNSYKNYFHSVSQFLAGIKIAKSFVMEDRCVAAFAESVDGLRDNLFCYSRNQANARFFQEAASACFIATFLWVGAGFLRLPTSEVLVIAVIFYRLLPLVQGLQQDAHRLLNVLPAAQANSALLQACLAASESKLLQRREAPEFKRELCFDEVTFSYDPAGRPTLLDISFRLPAGTLTVLTGPSGAGKTTLIDLLAGLDQPTQGRIWLDSRELSAELAQAWRRSVAYVLQDPFLFHATIRENLLAAKPGACESELQEALSLAGALGFVEALPKRLDTIVGDRGARFSGGERQRLALARALLRKPALLILDEPTSSLDSQNEEVVLSGIERLKGRLTMILVTHRPERVRAADQLLSLENGRLMSFVAGASAA